MLHGSMSVQSSQCHTFGCCIEESMAPVYQSRRSKCGIPSVIECSSKSCTSTNPFFKYRRWVNGVALDRTGRCWRMSFVTRKRKAFRLSNKQSIRSRVGRGVINLKGQQSFHGATTAPFSPMHPSPSSNLGPEQLHDT